jgi:hypothetical protein
MFIYLFMHMHVQSIIFVAAQPSPRRACTLIHVNGLSHALSQRDERESNCFGKQQSHQLKFSSGSITLQLKKKNCAGL